MPYCRICGTKLEENAHFCHKCGTPAAVLSPTAAPPVKAAEKNPFLVPTIVLIAVVVIAVIVGVVAFWALTSGSFNQANGSNQSNGNQLSFNFHGNIAKASFAAQPLMGKTQLTKNPPKRLQQTNIQLF